MDGGAAVSFGIRLALHDDIEFALCIGNVQLTYHTPQLPWVGLEWRSQGVPAYLSFAFWEWVTCVVFSAYTTTLSLATTDGSARLGHVTQD
jgi:hypothetical protein